MTPELARELGGANVRLVELVRYQREGLGMGVWSQSPHSSIVWLRRGRVLTSFADQAQEPLLREEGCVVFHAANTRRRSEYLSGPSTEFIIAGVSLETASGLDLLSFLDVPQIFTEDVAAEFRGLLSLLLEMDAAPEANLEMAVILERRRIALSFLRLLLDVSAIRQNGMFLAHSGRMRPIVDELTAHFAGEIDIGTLARKACLSRPQFHRQFKALAGLPPLEYVKRLRLREASRLLLNSDLSMREIGERVGWPNQFHFCRIFKASYGIPPLRYRNSSKTRIELLA